jgi:hypothetical protein
MELPVVLVSPVAGVFADRFSRRTVMFWSELVSILGYLWLLISIWLSGEEGVTGWRIYTAHSVYSVSRAFQQPAYEAMLMQLVPQEQYDRAVGMCDLSDGLTQLLAPLLGGAFILQGLDQVLVFQLVTWLGTVLPLLFLRELPSPPGAASPGGVAAAGGILNALREARQAWEWLASRRGLQWLLALYFVNMLVWTLLMELIPPLMLEFTDMDVLGLVLSANGGGTLLGAYVITWWGLPSGRRTAILAFCAALQGVLIASAGLNSSSLQLAMVVLAVTFLDPFINAAWGQLWQAKVPATMLGRIAALRRMICLSSLPLGALSSGPLVDDLIEPLLFASDSSVSPSSANLLGLDSLFGAGRSGAISLLFLLIGLGLALFAHLSYSYTCMRTLEYDLPSYLQLQPTHITSNNTLIVTNMMTVPISPNIQNNKQV